MNGMATFQNDVHNGCFLGSGATPTSGSQRGSAQTAVPVQGSGVVTGLMPISTSQPKLATNVSCYHYNNLILSILWGKFLVIRHVYLFPT